MTAKEIEHMYGEIEGQSNVPQTGTRWTEPGQGATVVEIIDALPNRETDAHVIAQEKLILSVTGIGNDGQRSYSDCRTNLALTGEPLTAYDVRRIGAAS